MLDLTLLGCWGDLKISAVTDHCMLGHYPGPEYLQRPSACLSHISDLVMGQRWQKGSWFWFRYKCTWRNVKMLLWKWVLTAGREAIHWVTEEKDGREPRTGSVPIKDEGDRLVCGLSTPDRTHSSSTALLCRCPLKAPVPKSAVAQKLLFKNLVGLCYEQCRMRKLPFLGFILHWTAFPGEMWTYPR